MSPRPPTDTSPPPGDPDDLLGEVARVAREDDMADAERMDRLKKLAAGELPDAELAQLRADAATSDELARDLEAFSPLGEEFHDRVVRRLQEETGSPQAEVVPINRPAKARRDAERPSPPRRAGTWLALAAAALVVVFLAPWLYRQAVSPAFQFPSYSMELRGEILDTRGDQAPSATLQEFGPGSILRLTLTPYVDLDERPDFTFYFADEQGDLFEWDRFTRDGAAARLEESVEDLGLTPGVWSVYFVYGAAGKLPSPRSAAALDRGSKSWRAVSQRFRVVLGDSAAAELPLEVLYAGCYSVSIHPESQVPECVPYPKLSIWVRTAPDTELELRRAGQSLEIESQPIDGGERFVVTVQADDKELEVFARRNGLESSFRLALIANSEPEWLVAARKTAYRGDQEAAREALERNFDTADTGARGPAAGMMARLVDNEAERQAWLETSVDSMGQTGQVLLRFKDLEMLWHTYLQAGQIERVRRDLAEIDDPPAAYPGEVHVLVPMFRGLLHSKTGDYRSALPAQRRASDVARRLGLGRELRGTETRLAETLQLLGRGQEADALLYEVSTSPDFDTFDRCFRSEILTMHGWIMLLSEDARALSKLRSADDLLAASPIGGPECDAGMRLNLGLNQAMALEQQGQTFESRRVLADLESERQTAGTLHQLWWHDLEGRLALRETDFEQALGEFRAMETLADEAFEPRAHWRAKIQIARALGASGRVDEALTAYAAAEELLDERSLDVPLDAGREVFVAGSDLGSRRYLELLLDQGRSEEAFHVARRSRSRVLRSIRRGHRLANLSAEQRLRWDLAVSSYLELRRHIETETAGLWSSSGTALRQLQSRLEAKQHEALQKLDQAFLVLGSGEDDLAPAQPPTPPGAAVDGELVLAYHPLVDGWAGFAALDGNVTARRLDLDLDAGRDLSERLLSPFERQIDDARTIRILASGALEDIDFHALPWRGDVLLRDKAVVYGLDLAPVGAFPPAAGSRHRNVLVVGDPRSDLPAAAREAAAVAAALDRRANSYEVETLLGPAATLQAVRSSIRRANLFHLAGHSLFRGPSGWESGFLLAEERTMTLGDVLSLEQAPTHVVLSSCESARVADRSLAGLGLAQAFLVAGSKHAIASIRPVSDGTTELLFRRLYADGALGNDLPERMRRAQLAWREHDAPDDWASFRVLVP